MKKLLILLLLSVIAAGASAQLFSTVKGNGKVITETRNAGSFHKIHSSGGFDVVITDGPEMEVKIVAEENILPYIETEVKDDVLIIRSKRLTNLNNKEPVNIYITASSLQAIRSSGSGNIHTKNQLRGSDKFEIAVSGSGNASIDVEASEISASVSGSGNMALKGVTRDLDGRISGSGNIKAKNLQSKNTSIKISGSGNAEVVATATLDTRISGSGDVKYWGNANVMTKIAGSGSVRKED